MTIQTKAIEQYFYEVLFINMLYKVVLTLESMKELDQEVMNVTKKAVDTM